MLFFNNLEERLIQKQLVSLMQKSKSSLKIAVTWFTNHELFDVVLNKLDIPHFEVELIVLNDRINNKIEGVDFQSLINKGGSFYYSNIDRMVHHKFCIIDNEIVVTGSYNWTYFAEERNWENILMIQDSEIVNAYIQEFEKIKQHHEKVNNVRARKRLNLSLSTDEYLISDYFFQAQNEKQKGNALTAAKIYTEILRINNAQPAIRKERSKIIQRINSQKFETCPFEIGIHFLNGYSKIMPAFVPLPITKHAIGLDPSGGSKSLQITIEKYDYLYTTLLQFSMENLKPCPVNTPKIAHTLTVDQAGTLTVTCTELNGYGRKQTHHVELRKFQ